MSKLATICTFALVGFANIALAAPQKGLPPNNIDCKDFTPLAHGVWYAHADAKPFAVGDTRNIGVRNSTWGPHQVVIGKHSYDLSDILDRKCGHGTVRRL